MKAAKKIIKRSADLAFGTGLAVPIVRLAQPGGDDILTVVTYHRITDHFDPFFPGVPKPLFDQQVRMFASAWNLVDEDQVIAYFEHGEPLPSRALLITFDDGFKDTLTNAWPILDKYKAPSLTFLATGCIEQGGALWTDEVAYYFRRSGKQELDLPELGGRYPLTSVVQRMQASQAIKSKMKSLDNVRRLEVQSYLADQLGCELHGLREMMLSVEDAKFLYNHGMAMGGHTVNHPILSSISREEAAAEINGCKAFLEQKLGAKALSFCYPNGRAQDYNSDTIDVINEAGFKVSYTTTLGVHRGRESRFEIKRVHADTLSIGAQALSILRELSKVK